MKFNINESQGKEAVKGLIELTQEQKKPYYKVIEKEILREVFK